MGTFCIRLDELLELPRAMIIVIIIIVHTSNARATACATLCPLLMHNVCAATRRRTLIVSFCVCAHYINGDVRHTDIVMLRDGRWLAHHFSAFTKQHAPEDITVDSRLIGSDAPLRGKKKGERKLHSSIPILITIRSIYRFKEQCQNWIGFGCAPAILSHILLIVPLFASSHLPIRIVMSRTDCNIRENAVAIKKNVNKETNMAAEWLVEDESIISLAARRCCMATRK